MHISHIYCHIQVAPKVCKSTKSFVALDPLEVVDPTGFGGQFFSYHMSHASISRLLDSGCWMSTFLWNYCIIADKLHFFSFVIEICLRCFLVSSGCSNGTSQFEIGIHFHLGSIFLASCVRPQNLSIPLVASKDYSTHVHKSVVWRIIPFI